MPAPIVARVQDDTIAPQLAECKQYISDFLNSRDNLTAQLTASKGFVQKLDYFQEQPQLIDSCAETWTDQLLQYVKSTNPVATPAKLKADVHAACRMLYAISKVLGPKSAVKYYTHEASDLEVVLLVTEAQGPQDNVNWETRYVLLLWLSMVVMVPFDLEVLGKDTTVADRVFAIGRSYLRNPDKTREAAARLVARFLTRADCAERFSPAQIEWCKSRIHDLSDSQALVGTRIFQLLGVLQLIAAFFKFMPRSVCQEHDQIIHDILSISESPNFEKYTGLRMYVVKIASRIGLCRMAPKLASWRYSRGFRSVADNLKRSTGIKTMNESKNTKGPGGDAGALAQYRDKAQQSVDVADTSNNFETTDYLADIIDLHLQGLQDEQTVVRWSSAKGLGRITGRLPLAMADDVVKSILENFGPYETDAGHHGSCLALAELARRGLLLPARLSAVVPLVVDALGYDVRRGSHSVGNHVRDAACYVVWAFARAYEVTIMQSFSSQLGINLIVTSLFDREVNCRRAAHAAFQENVGRLGNFPHGLDILTIADYFSLSRRRYCYCVLAPKIAAYPEYGSSILNHLVEKRLIHWDSDLRDLAATSIAIIIEKENRDLLSLGKQGNWQETIVVLAASVTGGSIDARHGHILVIGRILRRCCQLQPHTEWSTDLWQSVLWMIPQLEDKDKAFIKHGVEIMRVGACDFITNVCESIPSLDCVPEGCDLSVITERFVSFCLRCLQYDDKIIQKPSAAAMAAICNLVARTQSASELLTKICTLSIVDPLKASETPLSEKRGLVEVLGGLDFDLHLALKDTLLPVLYELGRYSGPDSSLELELAGQKAMVRAHAIDAIQSILSRQLRVSAQFAELMIGSEYEGNGSGTSDDNVTGPDGRRLKPRYEQSSSTGPVSAAVGEEGGPVSEVLRTIYLRSSKEVSDVVSAKTKSMSDQDVTQDQPVGVGVGIQIEGEGELVDRRGELLRSLRVPMLPWLEESRAQGEMLPVELLRQWIDVLLTAFGDYTVDSRGDIGSRTRDAAMRCVAYLLPTVGLYSCTAGDHRGDPLDSAIPLLQELLLLTVKQCYERIDRVRMVAGGTLYTMCMLQRSSGPMFNHKEPGTAISPWGQFLEWFQSVTAAFSSSLMTDDLHPINYASAKTFFPQATELLLHPVLRRKVLEGLVQSVGSMSETTRRHATEALVTRFVGSECVTVCEILGTLKEILVDSHGNKRVVDSILQALEALLLQDVIVVDNKSKQPLVDHLLGLVEEIKVECRKTKDIGKLVQVSTVLALMLHIDAAVELACLRQLGVLLAHRIPRVRLHTAAQTANMISVTLEKAEAYGKLIGNEVSEGTKAENSIAVPTHAIPKGYRQALAILLSAQWDQELDVVRGSRDEFCEALKIPKPKLVTRTSKENLASSAA
eukprot:Clim_evm4s143 gene=Clim_evmTU4s143